MSRSNPNKRKQRFAVKKRLLFGEGPTENAFLKHLRSCFSNVENNIGFDVYDSGGGGPKTVLRNAIKKIANRTYSHCLILMDTDDPWPSKIPNMISKKTVLRAVGSHPCIEGVFLRMLGVNSTTWNTDKCKKEFHEFLPKNQKYDPLNYQKHFPKEKLIEMRTEVEELDAILNFFEV